MKHGVALLTLFLSLFWTQPVAAALGEAFFLPPHADYKRITTKNFEIVFPGAYVTEGRQAAVYLEEAHTMLAPYYSYEPGHRMTAILIDNEDSANGVTSAVGLQGVILFMTRPEPYQSIGEYENWLKNLIVHEYAHYLTLEQTRGYATALRYVFGNAFFPNHFWPTWLAEGVAVHAESTFTAQGRGHGTYFTTITRDGLFRRRLGSDWLSYPRLMGPAPDYPFGESHYYAGFGIVEEMIAEYGQTAPARYATQSAGRVPYFLDGGLKALGPSGLSFRDLWENWLRRQARLLKPELDWLATHGSPDPDFLTEEGVSAKGARLSPDGKLVAYALQSGHERASIQLVEVSTRKSRHVDDAISGVGIAWSPDGRKLYYAKQDFNGPHALYSDLYEHDLEEGETTQLTDGARAKDPELCGNQIVHTTQNGRFSEIRALDLAARRSSLVYRAPENHHVSNPRCTADGKTVFFSEHSTRPLDFVRSVALDGTRIKHEFGGYEQGFGAIFPQPAPNGDVYFTRVKDGHYDLARFDRNSKIDVLARSPGGYWLPSLSARAERMAVSYVSSTGIRASLIDLSALKKTKIDSSAPTRAVKQRPPGSSTAAAMTATLADYNLLTSLAPRLWSPYLVLGDEAGQYGGAVLGWDDTDQLAYSFLGFYDRETKRPGGSLSTRHRIGTLRLDLSGSAEQDGSFDVRNGQRVIGEERRYGVALARPFPAAFYTLTPTVVAGWARTWYDAAGFGTTLSRPELSLGAELVLDSRDAFAHSITAEQGALLRVAGRRMFERSFRAAKALISAQKLIELGPRHGNLSVTGYGAWAPTPKAEINGSSVRLGGQGDLSDLNPPLRGYRLGTFATKLAGVLQAEYRLPIAEIFRGLGNWPFFFRNLGVFGFYDGATFDDLEHRYGPWLSGAGGGILMNLTLGYSAPLQLRIEAAHGLKRTQGGDDTVTLRVSL